MLKLLRYLKGYLKETVLAPSFKLLEASFELFVPLVVAQIIDHGIESHDISYILSRSLILVLLSIVGFIAAVSAQYFSAKAAVGFATKVRSALFAKIVGMSYSDIDRAGSSSLITRMTSDINQLQSGVNLTLRLFLRSPFIVFGAMIMAFTIDRRVALIFAVMIAVLCLIVFGIMLITIPLHRDVQNSLDTITLKTRENLTGSRILRGFRKEAAEKASFSKAADVLEKAQRFAGTISALMNPLTFAVVNLSIIALIFVGELEVGNGSISQGQLIALYNYMTQILVELIKLASLIITLTKAAACGHRVSAVIDSDTGEKEGRLEYTSKSAPSVPKIEFRNVSFRYDGASEDSLSNISFSVMPGQTIGIIGATGSGKSTLVNLIPAFYSCGCGDIFIDGVNVKDYKLDELRNKFGIVPQKAVLFRGTIRDNLKWRCSEATDEELMIAVEAAQAADVVLSKPNGLDATVDQNGKNFSGGQRQRLTIARALVGEPDILIFDDSSSALDYATDAALRASVEKLSFEHTTLIVSQRTSSIMHADTIIVLDDGNMVGIGTHEELYGSCDTYKEIHDLQFSEKGGNA